MRTFVIWAVVAACLSAFSGAFAADDPEFEISIGKLTLDGEKDAGIQDKCTEFELDVRVNHAGGPLDNDSDYTVYVCYDRQAIYFACDADDDVPLSSDVAEADYRDSDYIRFYLATEDDFEGVDRMDENHYAFVWTPQDKNGDWNPQVREVSKTAYGGVGHIDLEADLAADHVMSASGPTNDGWYIEAAIDWDVLGVEATERALLGRIVGVMFISGDTDIDNEGPAVQEREGEARIASDETQIGGYWSSPDHFRVAELEDGLLPVDAVGKTAVVWGAVKAAR